VPTPLIPLTHCGRLQPMAAVLLLRSDDLSSLKSHPSRKCWYLEQDWLCIRYSWRLGRSCSVLDEAGCLAKCRFRPNITFTLSTIHSSLGIYRISAPAGLEFGRLMEIPPNCRPDLPDTSTSAWHSINYRRNQ